MKNVKLFTPRRSALALAVATAFNVQAEQAPASDSQNLEQTVITGGFQQSLINRIPVAEEELPFTFNVVDREFIDDRNFTRPIEALTALPNIFRAEDRLGTGTTYFFSRGFEAPTLVDNRIQNNFRGAGARDDSFVERYEVLRGPASIAAGPVGGGGIINSVTKSPEADRFAHLKLKTDQFGSFVREFDANAGEIDGSDAFLVRVSGAYRDYRFDADETKRETKAIRPVATVKLSESTSLKASFARKLQEVNPNAGFPLLTGGEIPSQVDTDTFTGYTNGEGLVEDTLYDAELKHDFLDNLKLTVRGSRQETNFGYQNTGGLYNYGTIGDVSSGIYAYGWRGETESQSDFFDAQLAYTKEINGLEQDFAVGVAYDKSSFDRDFSDSYDFPAVDFNDLDTPRFGPDYGSMSEFSTFDQLMKSVFVETALRPSDALTFVAGLRYDDVDQLTTRRGFPADYDDSEVTARIGASYEIVEDLNVYSSFAQAFIPQFGVKRGGAPAEAETSEGFELGAKGWAFDEALAYQLGVFYTDRENVEFEDPTNTPAEDFVVTAGKATVQGVELTTEINPIDGLDASFTLGYTDIEITDGKNDVPKPVFPNWTSSAYVNYQLQDGALQGLEIGGGYRYLGDRNGPLATWDAVTIADLNFGYPVMESLEVSLDVLNVTDEKYVENTATNSVNSLGSGAVLGAPRTYALSLDWKFN